MSTQLENIIINASLLSSISVAIKFIQLCCENKGIILDNAKKEHIITQLTLSMAVGASLSLLSSESSMLLMCLMIYVNFTNKLW
jgi:hypothetical protein